MIAELGTDWDNKYMYADNSRIVKWWEIGLWDRKTLW